MITADYASNFDKETSSVDSSNDNSQFANDSSGKVIEIPQACPMHEGITEDN